MKLNAKNKKIVKQKMVELNTTNINDIISNFITREQIYEKRITLLKGAIKHYEAAFEGYKTGEALIQKI